MKLNRASLCNKEAWSEAKVTLPLYDPAVIAEQTAKEPIWVHFGAGNIFRGFIAVLQHRLLNADQCGKGIIAAETFDFEIIDSIYKPFDNLTLNVILDVDASIDREIIASVTESHTSADLTRLSEIFATESLQMVSFTVTEKGYALHRSDGTALPIVEQDMQNGPAAPKHAMSVVTALLHKRYLAGAHPIAMVSMDNCSHNGDKLRAALLEIAVAWQKNGHTDPGFTTYISDKRKVSFPWSMIDKITPRPAAAVEQDLTAAGVEDMQPVVTAKGTYIAPFVNAERTQYLVIEDDFPNGRPMLENAGVYFTNRETVNKVERMKVTTCLNPLHTSMSLFGCMLGYHSIWEEMKDEEIVKLIRRLGYQEGLPVVTNPGILSPKAFLEEVLTKRLPNPYMPDDPWRITTDTSQKVGIRFGETIKSYLAEGLDLQGLIAIPLTLAAWLRYLLAVDDEGKPYTVSDDPLKEELQALLSDVVWDEPQSYQGQAKKILSNQHIFGLDITATPLAAQIEGLFGELLAGKGAVRAVLRKYL